MKDADGAVRLAIEFAVHAVIAGRQLDPRHVAHARDLAFHPALDHDVAELLFIQQPPLRIHGQLEWDAAGHRRLANDPGGHLDVLLADRIDHVAGGEAVRRDLLRVEPDPHAVIPRAEDGHVADARQPRQSVLHLQIRVVVDVKLVIAAVGRNEIDHQRDVRRALGRSHAKAAHFLRQPRLGHGHAVLHLHLRLVDVRAELERDRQRHAPVAGALRRHVEHVLHAVDFLFDGRGDGVGQHLRIRARVPRGHHHRGRHDIGELRDGQLDDGQAADDQDDDRQYGGEDRAVDEEVSEFHSWSEMARASPDGIIAWR